MKKRILYLIGGLIIFVIVAISYDYNKYENEKAIINNKISNINYLITYNHNDDYIKSEIDNLNEYLDYCISERDSLSNIYNNYYYELNQLKAENIILYNNLRNKKLTHTIK